MANPTNEYVTQLGLQQPSASDLTDGTTGSGAVVLAASPALTSVPTAPTASPGTNTTQIATTAFVLANSNSTPAWSAITTPRWSMATANGSSTTLVNTGPDGSGIATPGGGAGANGPSSTNPPNIGFSGGSNQVITAGGALEYVYGHSIQCLILMNINRTTNNTGATNRFWIGITDQASATMGASDTPVGHFAAFRFSNGTSSTGDLNWICITNNNDGSGASASTSSSGVTPDTNFHRFAIVCVDTVPEVQFYIDSILVSTISTTTPSNGKLLQWFIAAEQSSVAANPGMEIAHAYISMLW